MQTLTLKEYDTFHAGDVTQSAFAFFREEALKDRSGKAKFLDLISRNGLECLQVKNYVGVISAPDGSMIEILPKHTQTDVPVSESRKLLWKMLRVAYDLSWSDSTEASLETHREPLPEVLVGKFLLAVSHLVHRGLRSDYLRRKDTRRFLKGRLDVSRQLRASPTKLAEFCIDFDEYSINRPENRLIKAALERVLSWKLKASTKRLAKELLVPFANVTASQNPGADFRQWRNQRDMAQYQPIKPWLELILNDLSPWTFSGAWHGISMLFPMEVLFEVYVERMLRRRTVPGFKLKGQAKSAYLVHHVDRPMFQLKPDLLLQAGPNNHMVLDTKWKLIDQFGNTRKDKYDIKEADMYQLFAYGHKYLGGRGNVVLIYPRHEMFQHPLPAFTFEPEFNLWVVPYDLESDELILPDELSMLGYFEPSMIGQQMAVADAG